MTLGDLIRIANDEDANPDDLHLVIGIGGVAYDVDTADEQDRFNPNWVMMALGDRRHD